MFSGDSILAKFRISEMIALAKNNVCFPVVEMDNFGYVLLFDNLRTVYSVFRNASEGHSLHPIMTIQQI